MQTQTHTRKDAKRGVRGVRMVALALLLGVAALAGVLMQAPGTASAAALTYRRGYSVQGSWLCYGWSNGAYHCTQHWHRGAGGVLISDNPSWVPNLGGTGAQGVTTQATNAGNVVNGVLNEGPCAGQAASFAGVSQWKVPGGCYARIFYPANQGYPSFGWCNYAPEAMHPWLGKTYKALYLPSHGGYAPKVGATIFYSGGVQGASMEGHYGVVVAIGPNGWVLSLEMNFYWRGGGWQKYDYRFVHEGAGVDFRW
jgi:hypothetical protein